MNNKRKNRTGPNNRIQRGGRPVPAQGVYNNSFFMHAATSFVGNLVQVQTHSGSIYEGVFKTFSPTFEVAIELAQCIKNSSQKEKSDDINALTECMIFHPNHIVSIVSKEVDPDYAIGGAFQTDSAISRCKLMPSKADSSRGNDKELEPWDPSGGSVNGDIELQLDGNANGWDANDMFNKNEKLYGVQSTYDNSLAGYTVPIEKKDTQEFKIAEAEAEKIAQEIENNPNSRERLDLENGDEEQRYAAVERPTQQGGGPPSAATAPPTSAVVSASATVNTVDISPDISQQAPQSNCNTMSKGSNSVEKYVLPPKRKNLQTGKLVRSTPPPNNNNGPLSQHSSHSNSKNNNFQSMQMQSNSPYGLNQNYSHMHGHTSSMSQSKINGEGGNNNSSNKPLPQRSIRQYPQQSNNSVSYSDQASNMSGQMSMGKPPVHVSHNHAHVGNQHMSNNMQESPPPPQQASIIYQLTPNQSGPPPQPQRQPRAREDTMQDLKKFQQDFHLGSSNQQQQQQQQHQQQQQQQQPTQQQMNQVKTPSVSPHQQPQPSLSPPQTHQQQQQLSPMPQYPSQAPPPQQHVPHHQTPQAQQHHQPQQSQQQQQQSQPPPSQQHQQQQQQQQQHTQQHSQQQQTDNSVPLQSQKSSQSHHQQQTDQQQGYQSGPPNQQQSPPTIISPNASCSSISSAPTSTTPPQQAQQIVNTSTSSSGNESNLGEKPLPAGPVKKTHQLNPAAKPFTPRSPSTPNPSRPHTPQTPGPAMAPGVYTAGPHVAAGQVAYVMPPQPSFQTAPHPHAGQQGRIRRAPIAASQMQVSAAAATGQPLLTAAPLQQIIHYQQSPHPQHFPSQPYQHMVRMYHDPPPQQIQFLTQTPPSTTPSPGQPHQQFHPGPQPSPAGGGPPAFGPAAQPTPHFPMMCPVIPQLLPNYYQGAAQTPHHAQQFQVIMQQQHPAP